VRHVRDGPHLEGCVTGSWGRREEGGAAYIAAADSGVFDLDEDIGGGFDFGYRPVLKLDFVDAF